MVIEPTRLKLSRFKYRATILAAVAPAALPPRGLTAVASPQKVWDIETYDYCMEQIRADYQRGEITLQELTEDAKVCCEYNDGVWNAATQDCQAPPGDTKGSRRLPGNIRIPSDIATAPVLTTAPRPIQVPSDIAAAPAASKASA
jgi:hypothetical protein